MSAFSKELFRAIALKPGRFLALLAIVALGAGFYAGLRTTAPDMKIALDAYLDGALVYDIRVVSTMGLDRADIDALSKLAPSPVTDSLSAVFAVPSNLTANTTLSYVFLALSFLILFKSA